MCFIVNGQEIVLMYHTKTIQMPSIDIVDTASRE